MIVMKLMGERKKKGYWLIDEKNINTFKYMFNCPMWLQKNKNEIVMVTEAGFAPYEYYDNNKIVGVDVEIAKEIASALGKKLVIKDVYFDAIINEIKSGKADFALAGMSVNEERKNKLIFLIHILFQNK